MLSYKKTSHFHKKLPVNTQGQDYFVGDIHGEFDGLNRALEVVGFDPGCDRLISTGDLIDRGIKSADVLELYDASSWFHAVMGNHELMFWRFMAGSMEMYDIWRHYNTWARPVTNTRDLLPYAEICKAMPITIEVDLPDGRTVGVVHAQPEPDWEDMYRLDMDTVLGDFIYDGTQSDVLWGYDRASAALSERKLQSYGQSSKPWKPIFGKPITNIDLVVCGHAMFRRPNEPYLYINILYIDTGAQADDGAVTLVNVASGNYLQIQKEMGVPVDDWEVRKGEMAKVFAKPDSS